MDILNKPIINESEIFSYIHESHPNISETTLKWELHHFIKQNSLTRIGLKKYSTNGKTYNYEYLSPLTSSIDTFLSTNYSNVKIVLWESRQLNEWLNLLINVNVIYIEVEKEYIDYIFSSINNKFGNKHLILLNPDENNISRYLREDLVIIRPLYSKSPINKNNRKIKLEKLIVDVITNNLLLDTRSIKDVVLGIKKSYAIDIDKALSYASRKRVKQKLLDLLGND